MARSRAALRGAGALVAVVAGIGATGCGVGGDDPAPEPPVFAVSSPGIDGDGRLAPAHTCSGGGSSPSLAWAGVPEGTRELVVVVQRDRRWGTPVTRWMVARVPPASGGLPEGLPRVSRDAGGIRGLRQGVNALDHIGWTAPCTRDRGTYTVRLLALRRPTRLGDGYRRADLDRALRGRVIQEATLSFRYAPPTG